MHFAIEGFLANPSQILAMS